VIEEDDARLPRAAANNNNDDSIPRTPWSSSLWSRAEVDSSLCRQRVIIIMPKNTNVVAPTYLGNCAQPMATAARARAREQCVLPFSIKNEPQSSVGDVTFPSSTWGMEHTTALEIVAAKEQEASRGDFPGPMLVILQRGLRGMR